MSAAEHTPGPWNYVPGEKISHDAEGWTEWAVTPKIVSLESGDPVVDDAEFIDPRDVRLIAAAPELLEVLLTVRDYVSDTVEGHIEQSVARTAMAREDLARIDAAIAKATS